MRIALLSLALWAALTYGSAVMPHPFNFIVNTDVVYPPPRYDFPFPNVETLKRLPTITEKHVNASLAFGQIFFESMKRLEQNLVNSGITVDQGSPAHGQLVNAYPTDEAMAIHKDSAVITKASIFMASSYCTKYGVPTDECASYVGTVELGNSDVGERCAVLNEFPCGETRKNSKYRNFDGSCNNIKRPSLGRALTGYKRLLHPSYLDGFEVPRLSVGKKQLPSSRVISSTISPDITSLDDKHTLALMQWAQLLQHDLSHTPNRKMLHPDSPINCCERSGRMLGPRFQHPSCLPITVPKSDPFYGPKWVSCLSYPRSVTTFRSDCTFGPAEQMNQATHFLDASHIYGTDLETASSLREKRNGLMKVELIENEEFLPLHENSKENCQVKDDKDVCFKGSDKRVNMHPHLTSMQILWLREHNRIARKLLELNPSWNDEILYQEARRVVIAEWQHITYNEWLVLLFGNSYDKYFSLNGYDETADPSISNSAATAAFQFFYSLLDGTIHMINEDRNASESSTLMEHFNRPKIVVEKLEKIIRGLTTQSSQGMDLYMADDVTQLLFNSIDGEHGLDILSMSIQQGRDHGLPPYNSFRSLCQLKPVADFEDLRDVMSGDSIQMLRKLYSSVYDVDLIVGALAEKPRDGVFVGPTVECLLGEQLSRTRSADRYFYSNPDQPHPFTSQQLQELEKATLSRLICDNVPGIKKMQKNGFLLISENNPLVSCNGDEIKRVDLRAWREANLITRTKRNIDKLMKNKD